MEKILSYCIRCGKPLHSHEIWFSKDDPDHEEALCHRCYQRFESGWGAMKDQNHKNLMESEE